MHNICNLITDKVKELAKALGKDAALTAIYINQWQEEGTKEDNRTSRYPTIEELKDYYQSKKPSVNVNSINIDQNNNYTRLRKVYNSTVLNYRINDIAKRFSNEVDIALEKELERAQDHYNWALEKGDKEAASTMMATINKYNSPEGRQAIIQDLTLQQIFSNVKEYYQELSEIPLEELIEDYGKEKGTYMHNEYLKIVDNFDALMEEACNIISMKEFFKIKPIFLENSKGKKVLDGEIEKTDSEEFGVEENNEDNEDGNKVTGNGWDFKARLIDPYMTQSNQIRKVLGNIRKVGHNNKFVTDDLGNIQTLNSEWVDQCLRRGLKDMVDASDFNYYDENSKQWYFPALQAMLPKYPWVSQIIQELQDNPELRGGFYANFRQDYIHYAGQTRKEDGSIGPTDFNKPVAEDSLFNETYNNYRDAYQLNDLSVYNTDGTLNISNAIKIEDMAKVRTELYNEIINVNKQVPIITDIFRALGFNIDSDYIKSLMSVEEGVTSLYTALEDATKIIANIKKSNKDANLIEDSEQYYKDISKILGIVGEGDSVSSFRDPTTKKDRNSYSAPNYMTTLIKQVKRNDVINGQNFLLREFGQDSWFRQGGKWKSGWIRLFEEDSSVRNNIDIKEVPSSLGIGYADWKSNDLKKILLREHFAIKEDPKLRNNYGWDVTPIPADAPVANFIKMKRYTGNFKKQLTPLLREVANQELDRINLCIGRSKSNALQIQNFDNNGKKFCFFPMFNSDSFMEELAAEYPELAPYVQGGYKFLDACRYLKYQKKDAVLLNDLLDKAVNFYMNKGFEKYMDMSSDLQNDIFRELSALGLFGSKETNKDFDVNTALRIVLEEYYWNQAYATTQMIELFVTDLAYFKEETDFQKRFKQCYAAGMKLNSVPHATDYGKEFRNNVYVKDQIITSSVYTDLKQALDEAIADGRIMDYDRDNILYKFRDVNVADAQAWITPETMRSVLDMMGKWDKQTMDPALERFEKGEWDMSDFEVIWQTIKPFTYTQIQKPDGFGGWLRVPHQNKNSEYLVLAAFSTIAASTRGSSKLKAIHEFMRKNNIDSIQMESAVKCGGQGVVELNFDESKLQKLLTDEIRQAAKAALGEKKYSKASDFDIYKAGNDRLLDTNAITQEEYNKRFKAIEMSADEILKVLHDNVFLEDGRTFNPEVVHTIPYRDYMIQQPTPQHLIDEEGIFGSQLRNITIADLPDNFSITIGDKTYNKEEFIREYQGCIVANVLQSFNRVNSRFSNITNLQGMLLDQVRSNSAKYGSDLISALQIVTTIDKDGKKVYTFRMPFSSPTMSKMQEIMTSAYKNGVTRQYIKGGNAILVSSWGKTDKLKLEYETTKDGKKRLSAIQCYLPAYSRKFYEPFLKEVRKDGNTYYELDVKKLQEAGLDKLIGYRIPTENKYSIIPLKVMGFLPQQNGSAIMLPAEITAIAGSDFDIDKMFLMIPEFYTIDYDMRRAKEDFEKVKVDYAETDKLLSALLDGNETLESVMAEAPVEFKNWFKENKDKYKLTRPIVRKVQYDGTRSIQENTRQQRNNHLIDLIYGMLTSQPLSAEVTSPGNFDTIKLHDRLAQIYNDPNALQEFKTTFGLETDEQVIDFIDNLTNSRKVNGNNALDEVNEFLNNYRSKFNTGRDPLSPDTFMYNHRQNMTSGKLIGIYANNTSMHLKYQHAPIRFRMPFKINGRTIQTLDMEFSGTGELITKNCAEFQAASVDGIKDPVLATLLQNEDTAKITGLMLRSGLTISEISYLFNQPSVRSSIEADGNLNRFIKTCGFNTKQGWQAVLNTVATQNLTSKMLLKNIIKAKAKDKTFQDISDERTANMFMAYFTWAADHLNDITNISRADSPNGSISNTLGGALIQTSKVDWIQNQSHDRNYPFILSDGVPRNNYSLSYNDFMQNPIATLQAFYTCGIDNALKSLSQYFPQLNVATERMLRYIIDNANIDFLRYSDSAQKTLNNYFRAAIQFTLAKTQLFGDDSTMTFEQKRDYYLNRFPAEFIQIKNSNEEIGKLGIIKKIVFRNGRLELDKSGRLRQFTRDLYTRDLDSLASMGEEGRKLANDLLMYSFYADGLNFGPNSFGNLFSTDFFNTYDEFMDALRDIDTFFNDETMYQRFLSQFVSTHPDIFPRVYSTDKYHIKRGKPEDGEDNVIYIPPQISVNKTSYRGDYAYVIYNRGTMEMPDERLYVLSQSGEVGTGDYSRYVEMPMYGTYGIYNPNYDLEDLAGFGYSTQVQQFGDEDALPDAVPEDVFDMPIDMDLPSGPVASTPSSNSQQGQSNSSTSLKPKFSGQMKYVFGEDKKADVKAATTLEAIRTGERTATTRYEKDGTINYWKQAKVGDIIKFHDGQGNAVLVRVTKPMYKLEDSGITPSQWSELEGWSEDYFESKVRPMLSQAWQMQYEYVGEASNQAQQSFRTYQQGEDMPVGSVASIVAAITELQNQGTEDAADGVQDILNMYNSEESNDINEIDLCKPK